MKPLYRRLIVVFLATALLPGVIWAAEFVDYEALTKQAKADQKAAGNYASSAEVKKALQAPDWVVADVRTAEKWAGAHIEGSVRVGRQEPEKLIEPHVVDKGGKFVKDHLIVLCNSAARASLEAETFKRMGFKTVKVYDIYSWIDECNPVMTSYTVKKDESGTGLKFGMFHAEHFKK